MFQVYRNKCLLHHFTSLSLHPNEYHQQSARSRQPYEQLRVQPAKLKVVDLTTTIASYKLLKLIKHT